MQSYRIVYDEPVAVEGPSPPYNGVYYTKRSVTSNDVERANPNPSSLQPPKDPAFTANF